MNKLKRFYILSLAIFINCRGHLTRGIDHQIYKDKIKFKMVYEHYNEKVKNISSNIKNVTYEEHKSFMRYRFKMNDNREFCFSSNKGKRFINLWELNQENCNSPYEDLKGKVELIPVFISRDDKDLRYHTIKNPNDLSPDETKIIDRFADSILVFHSKEIKEKNEMIKDIETLKTTEKMTEVPIKIVLIIFDEDMDRQYFYILSKDVLPSMNTTTGSILRNTIDMDKKVAYRPDYIRGNANLRKISILTRLFYASRIMIVGILYPIAITLDTISFPPIALSCLPYVLSPSRPNRCSGNYLIPERERFMDEDLEKKTINNPIFLDRNVIEISD